MTDHRVIRNAKITANAAGLINPIVFVGNSQVERMELAFGYDQIAGSDVLWAGIAGAKMSDLVTYIPWSTIAALSPRKLYFMGDGTNGAIALEFLDGSYDMTLPGAQTILNALSYGYSAVSGDSSKLVIVSDPPIEADPNIPPKATFSYARMMYYAATEPWTTFGWSTAPGPFTFIDQHYERSVGGCPSSSAWSPGAPCHTGPADTLDAVHLTRPAYELVLADVLAVL